jgi:subtilase family serine protease
MMLQLRRPAAQEQALQTLIEQLHDPQSPNYHQWFSAAEIGAQFGPAASDVRTITGWLQQQGFTVNTVYPNGMVIAYSGTAGQVRAAFHTEIHYLNVKGVTRFANMSDPEIPAALAPAVVGVVALHNIPPHPLRVPKSRYTVTSCPLSVEGTTCYIMTPPDLATIYNFNPLFAAGKSGQGQTIYLIEDTDLYGGTSGGTNSDWSTFRSTFGLSGYTAATLKQSIRHRRPEPTIAPILGSTPTTGKRFSMLNMPARPRPALQSSSPAVQILPPGAN